MIIRLTRVRQNNNDKSFISVYGDSDVITNPDDLLPPIAKLEKYAESDNIFNRSVEQKQFLHFS